MMTVCMVGVMYSIKQWMIDKDYGKTKNMLKSKFK